MLYLDECLTVALIARALATVRSLSVTSWQSSSEYRPEPQVFQDFKRASLVSKVKPTWLRKMSGTKSQGISQQGPNLLLASTAGLLDLAKCGALAPWNLDEELQGLWGEGM